MGRSISFDKACRASRAELTGAGVNEHGESMAQSSKNLCYRLIVGLNRNFDKACRATRAELTVVGQ